MLGSNRLIRVSGFRFLSSVEKKKEKKGEREKRSLERGREGERELVRGWFEAERRCVAKHCKKRKREKYRESLCVCER